MKHSHSAEIDQLLKHVEEKFSDLILPEGVVTKLELIGKGIYTANTNLFMHRFTF